MVENLRIQGFTDLGVRYQNNQDTYWVARFTNEGINSAILVMCDGMGGLVDGSYASQKVISSIRESVVSGLVTKENLHSAILSANSSILETYSQQGKQCGTTCSVVVLEGGKYWGYHIGDSRLYQFRGSNYKILTEDHTLLNVKRKKGITITPEMQRKYRSTLSRCIGVIENPRIDYIEGSYLVGDTFVACSDGFWHFWDMDLSNFGESIERVKTLGERDNISVELVKFYES